MQYSVKKNTMFCFHKVLAHKTAPQKVHKYTQILRHKLQIIKLICIHYYTKPHAVNY